MQITKDDWSLDEEHPLEYLDRIVGFEEEYEEVKLMRNKAGRAKGQINAKASINMEGDVQGDGTDSGTTKLKGPVEPSSVYSFIGALPTHLKSACLEEI